MSTYSYNDHSGGSAQQPPLVNKRERSESPALSSPSVYSPSPQPKRSRHSPTPLGDEMTEVNSASKAPRGAVHPYAAAGRQSPQQQMKQVNDDPLSIRPRPVSVSLPSKRWAQGGAIRPLGLAADPLSSTVHLFVPPPPKEDEHELSSRSSTPIPPLPPIKPQFRKIFAVAPLRRTLPFIILASIFSIAAGFVQPYMAIMVGDAFGAFTVFPANVATATDEQKKTLMHDAGLVCLRFAGTGAAGALSCYLMTVFWAYFAEITAETLRRVVFDGVQDKPMKWFDTGMGLREDETEGNEIGAGGLMGKFARETDEVRIAALAIGIVTQYLSALIILIIVGFVNSPLLCLVILSPYPIVLIIHAVNQTVQDPLCRDERRGFAEASTLIERTTAAIATVKAFNAQGGEEKRFREMIHFSRRALYRQAWRWATTNGAATFLLLLMFAIGFLYAVVLVANGKSTVAKTITAFWCCLLASENTLVVASQLAIITKGKMSLASLLTVIQKRESVRNQGKSQSTSSIVAVPARCRGGFDFKDVRFAYPSRPDVPVLRGINLFLSAGDTTFVVGGSGSGKSTIAQLLLRMYTPDGGQIKLDDQDVTTLPFDYLREHVAAVQQGCILFDLSVHDNVALGLVGSTVNWMGRIRRPEDVTREEVIEACQMAAIHDFIMSLPEKYDTKLGHGGSNLSGGQRQRIAIARARIRDPTVLILDEATSALDANSRIVVFEAIRKWRKNRTTIVITHDLSQIRSQDFVYVMNEGVVAEQGFRVDLVKLNKLFATMAKEQALQPLAPRTDDPWQEAVGVHEVINEIEPNRRASIGSFYALGDDYYASRSRVSLSLDRAHERRTSTSRRQSQNLTRAQKRLSWSSQDLQNGPYHPNQACFSISTLPRIPEPEVNVVVPPKSKYKLSFLKEYRSTLGLIPRWFPTLPNKTLFFIGMSAAVANGVCSPVFSYFIAKLAALLGQNDRSKVAVRAGALIAACFGQALAEFAKFWSLNRLAAQWTAQLRDQAYQKIMAQDKAYFDEAEHAPPRLVQHLIKDVDDMRHMVSVVAPGIIVVFVLFTVVLAWALAVAWNLTLVGVAIAPVYITIVMLTDKANTRAEDKNKMYREALAKTFYEAVANIRGIRAMALEPNFFSRFAAETLRARKQATMMAWVTSMGVALSAGMPLFSQALLLYTGAIFMKQGLINWETLLTVYTLILFGITFIGQTLAFLPAVAKSRAASYDFEKVYTLGTDTVEKSGVQQYPIRGDISFSNVNFTYPSRPDVQVLKNFNLNIRRNESIAIVGPSGCGKSTVASLIQRLYEPTSGSIKLGDYYLANAEVTYLRKHIGVVSQVANLFDATIAENVAYGNPDVSRDEIVRACKEANIHDFILSLPDGYETRLGENASLISGGQAQRLQIARALVRNAPICILDECTSALDVENQRIVLDSINGLKKTSTTIFITHSLEAMRRCDRIVCLDEGRVAEDGTYDQLVAKGGVFAALMQTGEWS